MPLTDDSSRILERAAVPVDAFGLAGDTFSQGNVTGVMINGSNSELAIVCQRD